MNKNKLYEIIERICNDKNIDMAEVCRCAWGGAYLCTGSLRMKNLWECAEAMNCSVKIIFRSRDDSDWLFCFGAASVREYMRAHHITQRDISEKLGTSRANVQELLSPGNHRVERIEAIADAIGCDMHFLFTDRDSGTEVWG